MKAVIYCRVSSKEQEESGYSLSAQESLLKEYSDKQGFKVAKKFLISESADGKKQRQIFGQMMEYVKRQNIKIIICEKVDRLTRNFRDAVMIDDWLQKDEERQVHLVKDYLTLHKNSRSQEKLNWGIRIIFAKNYIDNLSEEVRKGQLEKLKQGWMPNKPYVGYKSDKKDGHIIHIIDKEKAPLIKKIFELYATGNFSLLTITKKMYELGLRGRYGNKVSKSTIHNILTNSFYIGKLEWGGNEYKGSHETFIDKELFDLVQDRLRRKETPKYKKHLMQFRGLIRCDECGGTITWETHKGHWYGHCNHFQPCEQKTWVKQNDIEDKLLKHFDDFIIKNKRLANIIKKALKESHQNEINYHEASLSELNKSLELNRRKQDRLYDDYLEERIIKDLYERKQKQIKFEEENINDSIKKQSHASTKFFELGVNIFELSQKAKDIFSSCKNPEKKRTLLSLIFENMTLNEGNLATQYTPAFETLSKAINATNGSKVALKAKSGLKNLEHQLKPINKRKTPALASACPTWWAG